jgi:hypothetical protein
MFTLQYPATLDKRISRRVNDLSLKMFRSCTPTIHRITNSRAEQVGYYRALNNNRFTEEEIINEQKLRCKESVSGKVILCIHDTTEINLFRHKNRIKEEEEVEVKKGVKELKRSLGFIDAAKKGIGFKVHLSIAVDAKSDYVYGISHAKVWCREKKNKEPYHKTRGYKIEDKESYKWIEGCKESNKTLSDAASVIHIADREADIYELLTDFGAEENVFHIIRSRCDRKLEGDKWLWEQASSAPLLGTYDLDIDADSHGKSGKRVAKMEVRKFTTKVNRPDRKSKNCPEYSKEITLIETREIDAPEGVTPVVWRLITDCKVENFEQAHEVISFYAKRWTIEEVNKITKKENLNIEGSEMESGFALRKLALLCFDTAIKLYQMCFVFTIEEGENLVSISSFSVDEFKCLELLNEKYQGNTEKLKNPYKPKSTKWVNWVVARIGGWKGYKSQRKPGLTTIINGLEKFYNIYSGFAMGKDVCTR